MSVALRDYQHEAVTAALAALDKGQHPVLALPTGAGKGLVIGELCRQLADKRILVATHRKELLEQNEAALLRLGVHAHEAGVYSAGLERRERHARVIFGGIQSIYARMDMLQQAGKFDVVIVDEAHAIGYRGTDKDKESAMYHRVFTACPNASRVGLSATPYRLSEGLIYGPDPSHWFDILAYEIGMQPLIQAGYLAPLRGILTAANMPTDGVHIRQGDFVSKELSQRACEESIVTAAAEELCRLGANRQSWIVFCCDVAHTEVMAAALTERGIVCGVVTQKTTPEERKRVVDGARDGSIRALVNCLVFTTGFDVPRIDLIADLQPTQSKSRCVQKYGRGSRLSPETGKQDCVVIDLASNLERHKPLDGLPEALTEKTPARQARDKKCEEEETEKRKRDAQWNHGDTASLEDPFGNPIAKHLTVHTVSYAVVPSRSRGVNNLVATYECVTDHEIRRVIKQWICIEYPRTSGRGGRWHAEQWWRRRTSEPCPVSAFQALIPLKRRLPAPTSITVVRDGTYDRIVGEQFGENASESLQGAPQSIQQTNTTQCTHEQTEWTFSGVSCDFAAQSVAYITAYLAANGIRLEIGEGDTMLWRGPKRLATPETLAALKGRKPELQTYLTRGHTP